MITVLRLGHRPQRDKRITTHVCLTARALGADRVLLDREDARVESTVRDVTARFGGPFTIESGVAWRSILREHAGPSVHLTMYGEPLGEVVSDLRAEAGGSVPEDVLVVVGAEKVPGDVYELVTRNVGVGNQPHSEVAALGVFLYALLGVEVLEGGFEGGEVRVVPQPRGKRVVPVDEEGDA